MILTKLTNVEGIKCGISVYQAINYTLSFSQFMWASMQSAA